MHLIESLPKAAADTPAPGRPEAPVLLIVDDEEGPRESLKMIFEDDYRVLVAENGLAALELLRHNRVNAAVLDIRMGAMSGIQLLDRIKELAPDTQVIMLTAFEELETVRQALRLGACDYLSKPFDLATMRAAVAKAIERNRCAAQHRDSQQSLRELQSQLHEFQVKEEMARKRGEIYGIVLHDINNPLTVISALATIAHDRLGQAASPDAQNVDAVREQLTQIDQQVSKCLEISRRYLGFVRRQTTGRPTVLVNQVLSDLAMLLKPHPARSGHELLIVPLPAETLAQINGTDLIQILLNLVINAFQCTREPHQVKVSARLLTAPLDHTQFVDGPDACFVNRMGFADRPPLVHLRVQDNGPGIAVTPLQKVFEAFYTTKAVGQGTGLGLTIVLHLVEQANAGLYVRNTVGEGVAFNLFLQAEPVPN